MIIFNCISASDE